MSIRPCHSATAALAFIRVLLLASSACALGLPATILLVSAETYSSLEEVLEEESSEMGLTHQRRLRARGKVDDVCFHPSGGFVATGDESGTYRAWNLETGRAQTLSNDDDMVTSVAFSPDGNLLVNSRLAGKIRLTDFPDATNTRIVDRRGITIHSVKFSNDGSRLAYAGNDPEISLLDLETGKKWRLRGHSQRVASLAFISEDSRLLSASRDSSIRIWDTKIGQRVADTTRGFSRRWFDCSSRQGM